MSVLADTKEKKYVSDNARLVKNQEDDSLLAIVCGEKIGRKGEIISPLDF